MSSLTDQAYSASFTSLQNLKHEKGKPDTYVQVYLLPGTHKELKTKVVQNNSSPVFMETMKFQVWF